MCHPIHFSEGGRLGRGGTCPRLHCQVGLTPGVSFLITLLNNGDCVHSAFPLTAASQNSPDAHCGLFLDGRKSGNRTNAWM